MNKNLTLDSSPVQKILFNGLTFLVKRDDLLDKYFSGNKARKLSYFLHHDFPKVKQVISYGSVQSNSLLSIAALANLKGWELTFYVHNIPKWLHKKPIGNYAIALELGAKVIQWSKENKKNQFTSMNEFIQFKEKKLSDDSLFIPEGGHSKTAEYGIERLAKEIEEYCDKESIEQLFIMLPSGTGTTALLLNQFLRHSLIDFSVVTCVCVGDKEYLQKQFSELSDDHNDWPKILPSIKKYHFGKLYKEHYELWLKLKKQTKIEFDLLYDPIGWRCLLDFINSHPQGNILYIHQGGLLGNQSMVSRYKRLNRR
ncbi:MAG: 1-aminocyclopropane-1-carboxylate deaminase/D-cysteine desulfhydrase [Kangiellaceae bacterium]